MAVPFEFDGASPEVIELHVLIQELQNLIRRCQQISQILSQDPRLIELQLRPRVRTPAFTAAAASPTLSTPSTEENVLTPLPHTSAEDPLNPLSPQPAIPYTWSAESLASLASADSWCVCDVGVMSAPPALAPPALASPALVSPASSLESFIVVGGTDAVDGTIKHTDTLQEEPIRAPEATVIDCCCSRQSHQDTAALWCPSPPLPAAKPPPRLAGHVTTSHPAMKTPSRTKLPLVAGYWNAFVKAFHCVPTWSTALVLAVLGWGLFCKAH